MGSFRGHALPGMFFFLVGVWWLVHVVLEYAASLKHPRGLEPQRQRSWKRIPTRHLRNLPREPLFKVFAAIVGICVELSHVHWKLVDEHNEFQSPNKFAHASMYGFFAFSGLIELLDFYKVTNFSRELEHVILAAAFSIEGMLFYFHLHGRDMFDVRIHTILFIIIFGTALVILLEACLPKYQRELFMARTVLCLTQATWFWEIAFTIYGSHRWIIDDEITEKQLTLATTVVTANFCWHVLSWLGVVLICCIMASCLHKKGKLPSCCWNDPSTGWEKGLLNERLTGNGEDLDEEKGLLSDNVTCNNNSSGEQMREEVDEEVHS